MLLENARFTAVYVLTAAVVVLIGGCSGGGDDGPSGPQLGAEIDLSLYGPAGWEDYLLTYRSTTTVDTVETSYWYYGTAVVYEQDAGPAKQNEVDCYVFQEEADYIFTGLGDTRYFIDMNGEFMYGIKIYGGGTWEPLYYLRPKMRVSPDHTPRVNEEIDFGASNLVFTYEDEGYRASIWLRSWTTYLGIEESLTVPAGTFTDVLKTQDRQRIAVKLTAIVDTNTVYGPVERNESTSHSWSAPGIGNIRTTAGSGEDFLERVLISATVDGVTYPTKSGDTEIPGRRPVAEVCPFEDPPTSRFLWLSPGRFGF